MSTFTVATTTMKPAAESEHPAPDQPLRPIDFSNIYIMHYRDNVNPNCSKGFVHNGDLRSAVIRSQEHCRIMGYKWVFVRPLVVDIDMEEKRRMHSDVY